MFNKIRKMMKNEKGFTLVELLAVIVILGIIVAIAIPAIGNVIEKAGKNADEAEVGMVFDAARLYEVEADNKLPVLVEDLIEKGYLDLRQGEQSELGNYKDLGNIGDLEVFRDEDSKDLDLRTPINPDVD